MTRVIHNSGFEIPNGMATDGTKLEIVCDGYNNSTYLNALNSLMQITAPADVVLSGRQIL